MVAGPPVRAGGLERRKFQSLILSKYSVCRQALSQRQHLIVTSTDARTTSANFVHLPDKPVLIRRVRVAVRIHLNVNSNTFRGAESFSMTIALRE
jgi:hypothetical protein